MSLDINVDPVNVDPVPSDLPEDTKYLGDRLDMLIAVMTDLQQATLQQQSPSSGVYQLLAGRNDFPQTTRLRVTQLVVASSAAGSVTLTIGSAAQIVVQFGAADTKIIPLPITIDAGKDVAVAAGGGAAIVTAFLTGFPESDRPVGQRSR